MIPYQKEKIENAVCYFAVEHRKRARQPLYQTFLYKYLALLDFGYLKEYGRPVLNMTYRAMERGPVPLDIYSHKDDPAFSSLFAFQKDAENRYTVVPKASPNLDYFSQRELKFMEKLIEIFAQSYVSSKLMSDVSHQEILAWKRTWAMKENEIIDYSLEFPENIFEKPQNSLTFPEEVYLVQKGLEHCV